MVKVHHKLILVCVCALAAQSIRGQSRRPSRPPQSRSYVQESISTKAGVLKLIRIEDYWIGETNWGVTLNRKTIYRTQDDVFGSVSFHTVFKAAPSGEIVLMQEDFGVEGGCVQFRVINLSVAGATITDRFGNCNNVPIVTQLADKLSFEFPLTPTLKPDVWIYQSGKLTQTSSSN